MPLIVKWPGKIKAGSTSDYRTGLEDWLPTVLDLIGASNATPNNIDGISIAPTLLGRAQAKRDYLYREFTGYGGQQAVWMDHWKGIRQNMLRKNNKTPLKIELYNLKTDIAESKDVAAKHPKVVNQIRQLMKSQHIPSADFPFKPID